MNALEVDKLVKTFEGYPVLNGISLEVREGEFVALIGPNGCGKTVFLRTLCGLTPPSSGRVRVLAQGRVTMAFQRSPLFPWMTVRRNLAVALNDEPFRRRRELEAADWLEQARIAAWADHYPHQISGGVRQRVNVVRSLMGNPGLVLMDEPFAALDYIERLRLQAFLAELQAVRKAATIFVTHDIPEAVFLADRILAMSREGAIRAEFSCPLPRPRSHERLQLEPAYHDLYGKLSQLLSES